jgi:uncharacterized membrane protein YidH (DUF202 family)
MSNEVFEMFMITFGILAIITTTAIITLLAVKNKVTEKHYYTILSVFLIAVTVVAVVSTTLSMSMSCCESIITKF